MLTMNDVLRVNPIMKKTTKPLTNQQLVRIWLIQNTHSQAFLARHTGVNEAIISRFINGVGVSAKVLIKMAEVTGLQLRIEYCVVCGKVINFARPCACYKKGITK